jgi:hypothetical protein
MSMHSKQSYTNAIMVILFIFSMATVCFGQSYWKRSYGGADYNSPQMTIPIADGNFLILRCNTQGISLLKINPNGDTIWTKTYAGPNGNQSKTIIPTADGNYLILGSTTPAGAEGNILWFLKIKPDGDTIWTKTYGGDSWISDNTIIQTADGNYLILGTISAADTDFKLWLLNINSNGDMIWTKTYGSESGAFAETITPTADGNFLILGFTHTDILLLKIKPNGETIWTNTYGGEGYVDEAQTIIPAADGNYLILGHTYSFGAGKTDIWLLNIKPNGDTLWTKTYGGAAYEYPRMIIPTENGGFLILGITSSFGVGSYNTWLLKIKPNGDTVWTRTYGNGNEYYAQVVLLNIDDNFLLVRNATNSSDSIVIYSIIDDQYAYKNSLFTFKIPTYGIDSLNFGYIPLKTPVGMTVSPGGTITWTPKTDSVYMDHAKFVVVNDAGKKDTLTFNIFVNSDLNISVVVKPSRIAKSATKSFDVIPSSSGNRVQFSLHSEVSMLCIYDVTGKLIDKIMKLNSGDLYMWPAASSKVGKFPAGKYFARASTGKSSMVKPFLLVR